MESVESNSFSEAFCDELEAKDAHSAIDEEYLNVVIEREKKVEELWNPQNDAVFSKCSRSAAVSWILEAGNKFGFRLHTVYFAVLYFDRFLAKRAVDSSKEWAGTFLAIACFSLAAKMEEIRVPLLNEYRSEYTFSNRSLQKMEVLVLATLDWNLIHVSPFVFLPHFKSQCGVVSLGNFAERACGFIEDLIRGANLTRHRASAIAAAAIAAAGERRLSRESLESRIDPIVKCGFPHFGELSWREDVYECYVLMTTTSFREEEHVAALSRIKRRRI